MITPTCNAESPGAPLLRPRRQCDSSSPRSSVPISSALPQVMPGAHGNFSGCVTDVANVGVGCQTICLPACNQRRGHHCQRHAKQPPVELFRQRGADRIQPAGRGGDGVRHENIKRQRDARRNSEPTTRQFDSPGRRSVHNWLANVPHKISNSEIKTGASTGPHHGIGSKNKTSQSSNECGQPHMIFRKT